MHFVNFALVNDPGAVQVGWLREGRIIPLASLLNMPALPLGGGWGIDTAAHVHAWSSSLATLEPATVEGAASLSLDQIIWLPPVYPCPSFRDFYAFEQHVKTARGRRGLEMVPEWYEAPVFYFSNADALLGHGAEVAPPPDGEWLDFELEVAAVMGRHGRDIPVEQAEQHIAGYTVLNDWSARDIQRQEMKVGLGPAKGKDFATSVGPALVTPDELEPHRSGKGYKLQMTARVNGRELSRGSWDTITFSFAEMIARASRGVWLKPGDLIGSGTVGTGCILELGPENTGGWLKPGDEVELEIEQLGVLCNRVGGSQN